MQLNTMVLPFRYEGPEMEIEEDGSVRADGKS